MKHHPACLDGYHTHSYGSWGMFSIVTPVIVWDDSTPIAIAGDHSIADRIVELLERHGLADVPESASAITAPWPAPDPKDRHT